MFSRLVCALFVFFAGVSLVFAQDSKGKLDVTATLFPAYDFARQVGKDKVNVFLLLPPGVEAHTFEPKPRDMSRINKAGVFIYTGKYMEPWAEDMLKGISNKNLVVVDSSAGIELMDEDGHDEGEEDDGEEAHGEDGGHEHEERGHHRGGKDPHIWLDLGNAGIMVDNIAAAFAEKDPANKDFYLANALEYKLKLEDLDRRFREAFVTAKHKTIIYGGHFAFGYFARRYGLKYDSPYEGFSPNAEPGPKAIAQLIDKLKKSGIKYIYYEELLDPKIARTVARETGAKMELLHGAHNVSRDDLERGVTFIDIMEGDLEKLKVGLECR